LDRFCLQTNRIFIIICSNGKGHLQRSLYLLVEVLRYFEPSQIHVVTDKPNSVTLYGVNIIKRTNYPSVDDEGLENWHIFLASLRLSINDIIISDNLVEPALFHSNSHIFANFFWHEEKTHFEISDSFRAKIQKKLLPHTKVYYSRLFKREYHEAYNSCPVGLFGNASPTIVGENKEIVRILFSGGRALHNGHEDLKLQVNKVIKFLGDREYYGDDYFVQPGVAQASFAHNELKQMDAIITRAGVGMLSDCLRFGIKPIIFAADDTEMASNLENLLKAGLAISLQDFLNSQYTASDLQVTYNDFNAEQEVVQMIFGMQKRGLQ